VYDDVVGYWVKWLLVLVKFLPAPNQSMSPHQRDTVRGTKSPFFVPPQALSLPLQYSEL
jgi:hypothetical protein